MKRRCAWRGQWQTSSVSSLPAWPHRCFRHHRPPVTHPPSRASIRSAWFCSGLVRVVFVRQIIPGLTWWWSAEVSFIYCDSQRSCTRTRGDHFVGSDTWQACFEVQLVSTGCVNFVASGGRLTQNRQQLLCMLSWRHGLTTATLSLQKLRDKLQRVLNAAARVVSDTKKFDRGLSSLLHDKLHWLDVPERVTFKLGLMTYRCLHGQAPRYLA